MIESETEVLVIGAGPAGCAAAAGLKRAGHEVAIVEKARFPRFVIGESLLPRCLGTLDRFGLLEAVRERGYLKKLGAVFHRCGFETGFSFAEQHTEGWSHAFQMPRADFDKTLADAVAGMGVPIHFGHGVTAATVGDAPRITVEAPDGARVEVRPRFVVDASGYGRVLPRLLDLERPSRLPPRGALFTHFDGGPPTPEGNTVIVLHPDGPWVWVIPFADGTTSVGVVGDLAYFEGLPKDPAAALRAALAADSFCAPFASMEMGFEPRRIDAYSRAVSTVHGPGFCLVGNATEFLDPVFSSGVTLALVSSERAADCAIRTLRGAPVDWAAEYGEFMASGTNVFRTYVESWYDGRLPTIFFAEDAPPQIRRQICSVLAGYVWDETNPFVAGHKRKVDQLVRVVEATRVQPAL